MRAKRGRIAPAQREGESLLRCKSGNTGIINKDCSLQHTTTFYDTLQRTAIHCNTMQQTATRCNTLQHTATHYSTLQHTANRKWGIRYRVLTNAGFMLIKSWGELVSRRASTHCKYCNTLQHTAIVGEGKYDTNAVSMLVKSWKESVSRRASTHSNTLQHTATVGKGNKTSMRFLCA